MDNYTGKILNNRYLLDKVIGVGGMAVVYKAYDRVDSKTVAVKILKDEYYADASFRKRFRNESVTVSVLSHPNIVKIYDVSLGDKLQYIVMEYINGITLKQYLTQKKRLSWQEAFDLTGQILQAMRHAHSRGVVHRDVKPQNIMLIPNKDGRHTVKVTDFGIAHFEDREESRTDKDVMGSVRYASPEQVNGDHTDKKSDIYSVGVVLYEMVTGQLPFSSGSAVSVALMQLNEPVKPPRQIVPTLPLGAEQIIMHALKKNPEERYGSAEEMIADMDELIRNPTKSFREDHSRLNGRIPIRRRPNQFSQGKPVGAGQTAAAAAPEKRSSRAIYDGPDDFNEDDVALMRKSYTVPILFTLILLIIAGAALFGWYFFADTDEVEVPLFVGKFVEEIREDKEYKYFFNHNMIETNLVYTTEYKEGYIISQSVEAGTVMTVTHSGAGVIRLNVAYTSASMTVPEIAKGERLQDARMKLAKMGFKVKTEAVVDTSLEESTVIRTDPESGASVAYGETITVYYAIHDADKVAVPSVIGSTLAEAKEELEAMGFKVVIEYQKSTAENAGLVISQSVEADTPVIAKETEITLIIGEYNGKKTTTITVTLPDIADASAYQPVYVYVGDTLVKTLSAVTLDGSSLSIDISGTGSTTYTVYIGNVQYQTGAVDFSGATPIVSSEQTYDYTGEDGQTKPSTTAAATTTSAGATVTLPAYEGKVYEDYFSALTSAGFDNIVRKDISSSNVPAGQVVSVSSDKSAYTPEEAFDAEITVYVSTGS